MKLFMMYLTALAACFASSSSTSCAAFSCRAFTMAPTNGAVAASPLARLQRRLPSAPLPMADIIDAEIVQDTDDGGNGDGESGSGPSSRTIVDASLDSAPEWKSIVVEFVELTPSGNLRVIPCRMPFTVDLDGVTYSVGTPYEDTVAILTDGGGTEGSGQGQGQPVMVDPDDDENEEVFQLAATALVENMGDKLRLRRTPRVLTVQGDLRGVTAKFMKDSDVDTDALLDEEDEDDKFLDDFFTEQLGAGYEEEFNLDDDVDGEEAERLLKMFDFPGLGTEEDDEEGIQKMLQDMLSGEDGEGKDGAEISDADADADDEAAKALPLFPFTGPDGTNYAFVQMKQNPLLVGREDPMIDSTQRLLLDIEEAAVILPRLEEQFHEEMKEAGIV